jgi:hypothetical protein
VVEAVGQSFRADARYTGVLPADASRSRRRGSGGERHCPVVEVLEVRGTVDTAEAVRLVDGDFVPSMRHTRRCTHPMGALRTLIGSPPVFGAGGV